MIALLSPLVRELRGRAGARAAGPAYTQMIETLRGLLDELAVAAPDDETCRELQAQATIWSARLQGHRVAENARLFGFVDEVAGHGQLLAPPFEIAHRSDNDVAGHIYFGEFFLGFNGGVHGGAIALAFDEILGVAANSHVSTIARTASLTIDYRAVAPVGRRLRFDATLSVVNGRKRRVAGRIWDGQILCAEAEGLFIELRRDQS